MIFLERGTTQSRKYEEYANVLDFSTRGRSKTVRGREGIIVTALGEERLTLLEILGLDESEFEIGEKDRKSTRLNSSHSQQSRMPSSA